MIHIALIKFVAATLHHGVMHGTRHIASHAIRHASTAAVTPWLAGGQIHKHTVQFLQNRAANGIVLPK
jgi:hypothetical protein